MLVASDNSRRVEPLGVLRGFVVSGILWLKVQWFSMTGANRVNPHARGDTLSLARRRCGVKAVRVHAGKQNGFQLLGRQLR